MNWFDFYSFCDIGVVLWINSTLKKRPCKKKNRIKSLDIY